MGADWWKAQKIIGGGIHGVVSVIYRGQSSHKHTVMKFEKDFNMNHVSLYTLGYVIDG